MPASVVSEIDRVAVQMKDTIRFLPPSIRMARTRVMLWVFFISVWRKLAKARRSLRRLQRSIENCPVELEISAMRKLDPVMGEVLALYLAALDELLALELSGPGQRFVVRFIAGRLDTICADVEDLQETAALASSERFREFVKNSLETV